MDTVMTWVITSRTRFYLHEDESLLNGLLRTGHQISYQCQEGYCGCCRVKLLSQSHAIEYPTEPLAMIADDEILPCCCQIKGIITLSTT